jgi:hypothetical protein
LNSSPSHDTNCEDFLISVTCSCQWPDFSHSLPVFSGYGAALTKVTINKEIPFGLRQISFQQFFCISLLHHNSSVHAVSYSDYPLPATWLLLFPFCCSFTTCYLAAVLLKQFIKQHWQEDEENFVPPVVSSSEKVLSYTLKIYISHVTKTPTIFRCFLGFSKKYASNTHFFHT